MTQTPPATGSAVEPAFYRFRGRLAQFRPWSGQADGWEEKWDRRDIGRWLASYADGRLGDLEPMVEFLPRGPRILEAGCGIGQLVQSLLARGYTVEGVDYAAKTIERVLAVAPDLPVRQGDIFALDVADGTYGGYISIGVIEHDPDGPARALAETRRVLAPGGIAILTVPHLNRARSRWLANATEVESIHPGPHHQFYQYYWTRDELSQFTRRAGLEPIATRYYATFTGMTRDLPLGRRLERRGFGSARVRSLAVTGSRRLPQRLAKRWGHMMMLVCRAV